MSSFFSLLFFFWNSPHPRSTLFPYTTLFRSGRRRRAPAWRAVPLASRFPRMPKRLVYLDNAATTPVRPEVLEAMLPYLGRSEEHTSELQSHSDLVCRLLLEKKKQQKVGMLR